MFGVAWRGEFVFFASRLRFGHADFRFAGCGFVLCSVSLGSWFASCGGVDLVGWLLVEFVVWGRFPVFCWWLLLNCWWIVVPLVDCCGGFWIWCIGVWV